MRLARTTIGSRFGYSGSGRRIWSATASWRAGTWRSVFGYVAAVSLVSVAWILVTLWYLVLIVVLGVFAPVLGGIWVIRWGDRRREFREQQDDAALLRMMAGESDGARKD
jgi:Flp pilus assembly protein TadB